MTDMYVIPSALLLSRLTELDLPFLSLPFLLQGLTPLHLAADRNHPELVKILLEHGADKEAKDREDGMTAREMVAPLGKGYEEVLKLLNG